MTKTGSQTGQFSNLIKPILLKVSQFSCLSWSSICLVLKRDALVLRQSFQPLLDARPTDAERDPKSNKERKRYKIQTLEVIWLFPKVPSWSLCFSKEASEEIAKCLIQGYWLIKMTRSFLMSRLDLFFFMYSHNICLMESPLLCSWVIKGTYPRGNMGTSCYIKFVHKS